MCLAVNDTHDVRRQAGIDRDRHEIYDARHAGHGIEIERVAATSTQTSCSLDHFGSGMFFILIPSIEQTRHAPIV